MERKSKYNKIDWTPEMLQDIIRLAPDHDRIEIAERLGVSVTTVSNKLRQMGVQCLRKRRPKREKPERNPNPRAWARRHKPTHAEITEGYCIEDYCVNYQNCINRAARTGKTLSPYCRENGNIETEDSPFGL